MNTARADSTMKRVAIGLAALGLGAPVGQAQLPVSGRPVPALSNLDTLMNDFMTDSSRTISAGVLGISRGGRVVFLHAYGELEPGTNLPETALMRLASITKPITAAAIQKYSQAGGFGPANLQRRIFNLSGNGGLLTINPPASPDPNAPNITLGHLLGHVGGWDRLQPNPGDIPINRVPDAGIAMNQPDALPTRRQLVDWAMQFALDFAPGAANYTFASPAGPTTVTPSDQTTYSNFGYLLLGEALDVTAPGGYLGYLSGQILSAQDWIPSTEWGVATTLQEQNNIREPVYVSAEGPLSSVFDYDPPIASLPAQYGGGYHLETMLAHGGLIASAQAMLAFGNLYSIGYFAQGAGATQTNTIGTPITAANPMPNASHTGSLPGASTILQQLGNGAGTADDVVIFIAFNERDDSGANNIWALQACNRVIAFLNVISAAGTWPTETCDGFWTTLGPESPGTGFGGYHSPYQGLQSALNRVADGSSLRLTSGSQSWTGTISKRVRLDAPEGPVVLGQ